MARPTQPRRARLSALPLEDRAVPAVDLTFHDTAYAAGTDAAGNVYVHGSISGTADLDPGSGTHWLTGPTRYVAKYTPAGGLVWARRADNLYETHSVLAVSPAGGQDSVYLMEFDGTGAPVLSRYQDTGTGLAPVWSTRTGAAGRIAVGSDGAVYESEMFNGTVDFDPADPADFTPLTGDALTSSGQDAFLAKWDASGAFQWVRQLGGSGNEWMDDLAVVQDGAGETVYVGGMFGASFAPGGDPGPALTNQAGPAGDSEDGFLVRYDPAGGLVSVGQFVDARVRQVAGGPGGTYLAGTHDQTALGLPGPGDGSEEIYFGKLAPDGRAVAWVKALDTPSNNVFGDLAMAGDSVYLSGGLYSPFGDPIDLDPEPGSGHVYNVTPAGRYDAFVASYRAADGGFEWARLMGGDDLTEGEAARTLMVSGTDVYAAGWFAPGKTNFVSDLALTSYAMTDGFVTRIDRAGGAPAWAVAVGSVVGTIDDGDAGYSEAGSGWKTNPDGGLGYDSRYHAKGSGGNVAKWSFAGLPAGTYDVLVTWRAGAKNATNATYKVNGTAAVKSQRVAPDDYFSGDYRTVWESLGTFSVGGDGKLTVTLSDLANGNVVADGVRIVFKQPAAALVASGPAADRPAARALTTTDLKPIIREAIRRWNQTGLTAAERKLLRHVRFGIADLDGPTLGLASGNTVTLDRDAAGYGWFVDRTPRRDAEFTTAGNQGEQGRIDLLTAVLHELGHVLGRTHEAGGVMGETLATGVRLSPAAGH